MLRPIPDEPLSERELDELDELESRAVAAPWWDDEDDRYYRLHGTAGWTPKPSWGVSPQPVNHQILKAAKKSEIFEPYWPRRADAELIIRMRNALPRMIKELRELRSQDGPSELAEARREIKALRESLSAFEAWVRERPPSLEDDDG